MANKTIQLPLELLTSLLDTNFHIQGEIMGLNGYQDYNYLVTSKSGTKYILKATDNPEDLDNLRFQSNVLLWLYKDLNQNITPVPILSVSGDYIIEFETHNHQFYARLLSYIDGIFLAECRPEPSFFSDLGRIFAQLDNSLDSLDTFSFVHQSHEWDLSRVLELSEYANLIENPEVRRLVRYFLMKYREEVLPCQHHLAKGLIHGDGNDWNILVKDTNSVGGIIDFGDMVHSYRINEVAILAAYSLMNQEKPLDVLQNILSGYQEICMLSDLERSLLYYLIPARWCQTVLMAARQKRNNPANAYHQVSVMGAQEMLRYWIRKNPDMLIGLQKTDGNHADPPDDKKYSGGSEAKKEQRYKYFSRSVSLSYPDPIEMKGAAMQYMYSADGKVYLDCVNNIPHVGHCHPKVVEAGQRQMARLNTNTRYLYNQLDDYAERLLSKFPPSLNRIFFVNSGSAATDLAVRLAEAYTGRSEYLVLDYAYHGNTRAAIGLSPYKFNRKGGKGKPDNVIILDGSKTLGNKGEMSLQELSGDVPYTFFAESIVGCAGQIVLSSDFMQKTVSRVRSAGGIYVADEVQTGFARVGHSFWAYELYDVIPDMVILGKPMGNGHPMGAVVCTEAIAKSFETGMEFFSSFGGNPVSCVIGSAVLDVIEEEGLQQNALTTGEYLLSEMGRWKHKENRLPHVADFAVRDIRGSGLFLGIELMNPANGLPATKATVDIVNKMKDRGFLLSTDGPYNNVIKFKPPMCFTMENAGELIRELSSVMALNNLKAI